MKNDDFDLPKLKEEPSIKEETLNHEETSELNEIQDQSNINDFSSKENITIRKSILSRTIITTLILSIIIILIIFTFRKPSKEENNTEYLTKYYTTYSLEDGIKALESIKDNQSLVKEIQTNTLTKYENDLNTYSKTIYNNKEELITKINSLLEQIKLLHNKSIKNSNNEEIRLIRDSDYSNLTLKINTIKNDSEPFYESIELYNKSLYNESYTKLNNISEDNYYYEISNNYKELCIDKIIELINNDIDKITINIDSLSEEEKQYKYNQIILIINAYQDTYNNIPLQNNIKYIELINKYNTF